MFTAFTTENYPDIMFPAYDYSNNSRWVTLFFAVYLYLGAFFFNALIIGVIIDAYWVVSKDEVKAERTQIRKSLALAWERLVGNDAEEDYNKISVEDAKLLELFTILKPDNNKEENQNLISMLDTINDGYIDPFDWTTRLLDILRIQFKNDDEESVENLVEAKQFSSQRLLIFLVPLHTILFLSYYVKINCYVYLGIHSAQTIIILVSFNVKAFRKKLSRKLKFDLCLYISALSCSVCWYITFFLDSCMCKDYTKSCDSGVILLSVGGLLRATSALLMLLRLIYSVSWFEKGSSMVKYLFNIVVDLFVVVMVLQYFFAQVGYESFVGTELDLSILISGRDASGYNCGFGFDSFVCSILIQLQIFSTNDWPAIMENLALDYEPKFFVYTYFIGCFIIINLVCMQMVIAVILEAFKIFANKDSQKDLQKLQDEKRKSKGSFNLADMLTTFVTQTASSNSSADLANKTRPDDSDVFFIGAKILVERDYTDQLNDIYLDKGDEIEIVDITNNHVTAAMGDIIGQVPKNILQGYKEPEAVIPNPRLSHRTVAIRPESWTVGVHGDMTVMNKDEMAKLNQVFKGSLVTGEERLHQRNKKRRKRTVSDEKPNWVESFRNWFEFI
ncbi:unnamed protein product [Oikopleura dioica]|uniref:Ion transport domain-containing protein n=1 Tax=Oikopleura dioica TaxID=34765 RepID=E4WVV7_OIKDI|nr:unnamed protein product [Oikopleura dioica]